MIQGRIPLTIAASASLLLAGAVPAMAAPPAAPGGQVVTQVLYPVIDTDARGISTTPTHWLQELQVANAGDQNSAGSSSAFLRFDVSRLPGAIVEASLQLNGLQPTAPLNLRTEYVADDSWQPTRERAEQPQYEMTGATKPASTPIDGTEHSYEGGAYEAPVGQVARDTQAGDGRLSLRVLAPTADASARAVFGSDENPTSA